MVCSEREGGQVCGTTVYRIDGMLNSNIHTLIFFRVAFYFLVEFSV